MATATTTTNPYAPNVAKSRFSAMVSELYQKKKDPNFIRYAMQRQGYDPALVDQELSQIQSYQTGQPVQTPKPDPNAVPGASINQLDLTAAQQTALLYGQRTFQSGKILDTLDNSIAQKGLGASIGQKIDEMNVGGTITNQFVPKDFQKYDQAKRDFVNATLRRESGAVISPTEFDNAEKQYFPRPGDSPEVVAQKKANRELVTSGLLKSAGVAPSEINFNQDTTGTQPVGTTTQTNPQLDQAKQWLQANPNDPRAEQVKAKIAQMEGSPATNTAQTSNNASSLLSVSSQDHKSDPLGTLGKAADAVANFLGIKKFGQGIGTSIFLNSKEGQDLQDKASQGDKYALDALQQILKETPSAKEIIGSAAMTALNVATAGMGSRATLVGKVAQGAATGYGFDVASQLQDPTASVTDALKPGIGTAVGAGLPIVAKGFSLGASAVKHISSYLSGVPVEAIDQAFQNPQGVQDAIKTFVKNDDAKMQIVQNAKEGLQKIANQRSVAYDASLKAIQSSNTGNLSKQVVRDAIQTTLGSADITIANKTLDFTQSALPKAQQKQVSEVVQRINSWKDTTPVGMNKLKKIVDSYYKGSAESKSFDRIITSIKSTIQSTAETAMPAIGEMNKKYAAESEAIKLITKELSLGKDVSPTTALNKLTSIFNRNGQFKEALVKQLGETEGQKLLDEIVGSMFTDWLPRGLAGRIITGVGGTAVGALSTAGVAGAGMLPATLVGGAMASPRVIGRVTTTLGKAAQGIQKLPIEELKKLSKTALLDLVTKNQRGQ